MTGVPVLQLRPGQQAHLEPHQVHGRLVCPHATEVEVDSLGCTGDAVVVNWHPRLGSPGAQPGTVGCTTYSRGQCVEITGGEAA